MSLSVCPCYAAADRELATKIAGFLEQGADVRVFLEEGEMQPGDDLLDKAADARTADIVLVLFSRACVLPPRARSRWEPVLIKEPRAEGVRVGFVTCDDWAPPPVLQPRFDCRGAALQGFRELKRWVRERKAEYVPPDVPAPPCEAELAELGIAIADRPGIGSVAGAAVAYEFARRYREDFDEMIRLECADRGLAALAGDLAAQLGLRLEGGLEDNLARLREFCQARRFLFLLEGASAPPPQLLFGGRCSTLVAVESGPADPPDGESLRAIQSVFSPPGPAGEWSETCRLARVGRRLSAGQGRLAECYELMEQWHAAAEARGDRAILDEKARVRCSGSWRVGAAWKRPACSNTAGTWNSATRCCCRSKPNRSGRCAPRSAPVR